jgi:hypothetical protein
MEFKFSDKFLAVEDRPAVGQPWNGTPPVIGSRDSSVSVVIGCRMA